MVDASTALDTAERWSAEPITPAPVAASASAAVRRALDVSLSFFALLFLLPLFAAVALAIWLQDRGPVLFGHTRIGRYGREFRCLKFRSMVVDADKRLQRLLQADASARAEWLRDHKLRCDPRVTALGRFLRQSSLDELPQLFNVLRGDMSLVGPRPIVASEVARYGRYFPLYASIRPGVTGLWQVSGRNQVSYRRRVALDVTYARSASVRMYLAVLFATVPVVLLRRGAF